MKSIGILGAGAIGTALARRMVAAGLPDIAIGNSRGPSTLDGLVAEIGGALRAADIDEVTRADLVVLAVPWSRIPAAVSGVADWEGRIVVDTTNPIEAPLFRVADLDGRTSSEVVAEMVPGARVVKACNTLPPHVLGADPRHAGGRRVIVYSGDDTDAKADVAALLDRLGYAGIDLGGLATGGALHQFPGGPFPTLNLIRLD